MKLIFAISLIITVLFVTAFGGENAAMNQNQQHVEAIDWNNLAKALPASIEGFEAGELDGGTFNMANPTDPSGKMSYSSVSREYTKKDADGNITKYRLTIMDSGFNQMLIQPFLMNMEYDTPKGYMKWDTINDRRSALIVDKSDGAVKNVHLLTLVDDRLMVTIEGNEKTTVESNKKMISKIDYSLLEGFIKEKPEVEKSEE